MKITALIALAFLIAASTAAAEVPNPTVTGPVSSTGIPGNSAHDYTFFATNHELALQGYVEQEFFIQGTANRYNTPAQATGTVTDGNYPYKTRVVVRRPADAKRFNGTVLVEWYNVTNGFDAENMWFFGWEHMLRGGYIWVGVSTQQVGVTALKAFSMARYGTVDVNHGGTVNMDALSYDIFSQAGQAIRNPKGVDLLGGLKPRHVVAIGESQSASRLSTYVNSIHPLANVYEGFLLFSSLNQKIRTDLNVPVWKMSTEFDVGFGEANVRQADSKLFRSWEIAGTSHVDYHLRMSREPLELRDIGTSSEAKFAPTCGVPDVGTRAPLQYVLAAGLDLLSRWVDKKTPPPAAPPIKIESSERPIKLAHDSNGLALGGIRLAEVAVPTGLNSGTNTGPGACARWGYYKPFDLTTLNKLYPTHVAYVSAVERAANENLRAGFILKADADSTIREARESMIGRMDDLEGKREVPISSFDRNP
ncbi:MAG TPA: alpha/beta hydrolase domain-containing protein [Terriglobia bacterium]